MKTDFRVNTGVNRIFAIVYDFVEKHQGDMITTNHKLVVKDSILNVAKRLQTEMNKANIGTTFRSDEQQYINLIGDDVLIYISKKGNDGPSSYDYSDSLSIDGVLSTQIQELELIIAANLEQTELLARLIKEIFASEENAAIKWWFENQGRAQARTIYLDDPKTKLLPEFYPDLTDHPEKIIEDYLKSSASVLLMAGEPGTGKTTLLRHMIFKKKLRAAVIYDEALMNKDSIFQDFLFGEEDILIIEDADKILASRDEGSNPLMSRFLSVSDGLIKLPNKKMVFTTNIVDFHGIDEALLRPGRCYGLIQTRKLDLNEAIVAAKVGNLPVPTEKRTYSLAELFNRGQGAEVRRMGFAA